MKFNTRAKDDLATDSQNRVAAWAALQRAKTSLDQLIEHTPSDRSYKLTLLAWFGQAQKLSRAFREAGDTQGAQQIQQTIQEIRNGLRSQSK